MVNTIPSPMPRPPISSSKQVKARFTGLPREVREGTGWNYRLLAIVYSGDSITLCEPRQSANQQTWAWVRAGNIEGYMVTDMVEFIPVTEDATKPVSEAKAATQETVKADPDGAALTRKILLYTLSMQLADMSKTFAQLAALEASDVQ